LRKWCDACFWYSFQEATQRSNGAFPLIYIKIQNDIATQHTATHSCQSIIERKPANVAAYGQAQCFIRPAPPRASGIFFMDRDFLQAIRSGTLQAALEVAEERAKK
jgi:hypothetical protein